MTTHRYGSTLTQVMAWCLTAPSHYLNQYGFLIREVLWHTPQHNFIVSAQATILYNEFENSNLKITATSLRGQWVHSSHVNIKIKTQIFVYISCYIPQYWIHARCYKWPTFWNVFSWKKTSIPFIQMSQKFPSKGLMDNKLTLAQEMIWHWTNDEPISESN